MPKFKLKDLHYAKLIKVLDKNDELDLNSLPKNCIIKTNNGWNDIIVIKNKQIELMNSRGQTYSKKLSNYNDWKKKALSIKINKHEQQYQHIVPEIFVEEHLGDNLIDYKFYCIHGKVIFIILISDRFQDGKNKTKVYFDKKLNKLDITQKDINYNFKTGEKKHILRMVEMSEIISSLFEFARIDFYLINNKIYFGEVTFTPMACNVNLPKKYDVEYGKNWV